MRKSRQPSENEPSSGLSFENAVLNAARTLGTYGFDDSAASYYAELVLKTCSEEDALAALEYLMKRAERMPSPSQVLAQAGRKQRGAEYDRWLAHMDDLTAVCRARASEWERMGGLQKDGRRIPYTHVDADDFNATWRARQSQPVIHWSKCEAGRQFVALGAKMAEKTVEEFVKSLRDIPTSEDESWTHSS